VVQVELPEDLPVVKVEPQEELVELEARPEVPVERPERPEVAADVVADYCYCLGW